MKLGVLTLVAGLALAGQAWSAGVATVNLDAATQARLGILTQPLVAARHTGAVTGFARVLDPVPLATLDADLAAAAATAEASQAEATRTRALAAADATVSLKVAQSAAAQARADGARLALLRRRVGLEWGPAFAADGRRARLISDIAAGRAALVRIDAPVGVGGVRSALIDLGPGRAVNAMILGAARTADPRLQSSGLIAVVIGPQALLLASGMTAPVTLNTGGAASGVVIPRSALIRTAGRSFAYVRRDNTHFERRAVTGGASDPGGLFAAGGFSPGEAVVTAGASALLAAEHTPSKDED